MSVAVTQMDIAREAGVSQRTVSAVLGTTNGRNVRVSPERACRIRAVARLRGYTPCSSAQLMRGKRSGLIGVLMGDAEADVQYQRLALLDRLLRQRGYRIMVGHLHTPRDVDAYVEDFRGRRAEGVICLRHEFPEYSSRYVPRKLSILDHVVYLDPPDGVPDACFVKPDRRAGIRAAVAHLIARHHSRPRVGVILLDDTSRRRRQGIPMRDRQSGYQDGLRDAGLPVDTGLIWKGRQWTDGANHADLIERMIDELVIKHGADAILAGTDTVGVRLIKALQARGMRVPDDVAVIGYDNHAISRATTPELTTIDHDQPRIAQALTEILMALIDGRSLSVEERRRAVTPNLVLRGSA